ncbi:MAG: virulence protein RhuM/Fic/DOC family protein [Candidatus Magasanikbacteria bacterium]|nr:virulence protein RhuM/Fic/DOC family protein [Candidatus Magasanikbacteria bacterium]
MPQKKIQKDIIIYQTKSGKIEFRGDFTHETVWASLDQISNLFGRDKSVISRHIKNIFKEGELKKNAVVAKNATTAKDGKTYLVEYYNLDAIISIGYRVNSKTATHFRKWATNILRDHITTGYTINKKQIVKNYDAFMENVSNIQQLLPEHVVLDPKAILDLIKEFASTWVTLDAYDKEKLTPIGTTKKSITLSAQALVKAIETLRHELIQKGEASDLFAQEKNPGAIEGIFGNVMQTFGGKPVYPTAEERAAHLLYFMVKNHPFTDGNKRSGAFAFVWFLRKTKIPGAKNINASALTALTLLIAKSLPNKKDQMIALVVTLLSTQRIKK